ncbi:MAG TPA: hypothetical protein VIO80_08685, partial [Candidatus Dormibacteraeota bacterium]
MLRHRSGSWPLLLLVAAMTFALWPASAFAHSERPTKAPDGTGSVPGYRTTGPHLVVCKSDTADFTNRIGAFPTDLRIRNLELFAECLDRGYRDLQAAVDHVTDAGTTIYVLPGIYLEEPSLAPESDACNHLVAPRAKAGYQILSYEQQKSSPHQQNLVGIFGIKDLQHRGHRRGVWGRHLRCPVPEAQRDQRRSDQRALPAQLHRAEVHVQRGLRNRNRWLR